MRNRAKRDLFKRMLPAVCGLLAVLLACHSPDPARREFGGLPLSEWENRIERDVNDGTRESIDRAVDLGPGAVDLALALSWSERGNARMGSYAITDSLGAAAVEPLSGILRSEDTNHVRWAARALGRLGEDALPASGPLVETLIAATEGGDTSTASEMASALVRIGPRAHSQVQKLLRAEETREQGLEILEEYDVFALALLDRLSPRGDEALAETRRVAASIRTRSGAVYPHRLRRNRSNSWYQIRMSALVESQSGMPEELARELGIEGLTNAQALKVLEVHIEGTNPARRRQSVEALLHMGALAQDYVPRLVIFLQTDDMHLRWKVAELIARYGSDRVEAVPALESMLLNAEDPTGQALAAWALGEIGKPAKMVVPELVEMAQDTKSYYRQPDACERRRRSAAGALARIAPGEAPAILIGQLGGKRWDDRRAFITALALCGEPAIDPLREVAASEEGNLKASATAALLKMGDRFGLAYLAVGEIPVDAEDPFFEWAKEEAARQFARDEMPIRSPGTR